MSGILVTGGTGSLGRVMLARLAKEAQGRIVCYSRDEHKQAGLLASEAVWAGDGAGAIRYLVGDIRDRERLARACHGIETIIHIAALTYVGVGVYNPDELVKTNVLGTMNVIDAAVAAGVSRVVCITSDKGCHPANIYGASKMMAEHYAVQANAFAFPRGTRVACIRFGNLLWSRGSVASRFVEAVRRGEPMRITDRAMTRFGIRLEEAVDAILSVVASMRGGEVVVPDMPAFAIWDLATAIGGTDHPREIIGYRGGGEKLHETILTPEEIAHAVRRDRRTIIEPEIRSWDREPWAGPRPDGPLTSQTQPRRLYPQDLARTLDAIQPELIEG